MGATLVAFFAAKVAPTINLTGNNAMLRQIITPTQRQITLEIPESYLNQAIEIIAFRMNESEAFEIF